MKNAALIIALFCTLNGCSSKIISHSIDNTVINSVTEKGAWCWFADPRAIHYQNRDNSINSTYIGYINVHGDIKAMQIDHLTNSKKEVLIRSYFQPDDHNNPTFLVLPDERIMIFYSRHTDEPCFYYRVSHIPGDITTLGKEMRLETDHNTTYPSPFILSDDPDHIYLCWRGVEWHPTIARLTLPDKDDKVSFDWGPHQIVRSMNGSLGVRPYAKYVSNGKNKIYLAYTTNHPDNQSENWIYFNSINILTRKLCDVRGQTLSQIGIGEPHQVDISAGYKENYPYAVVDSTPLRNWIWELAIDQNEYPIVAITSINESKDQHNYYHVRWDGKQWIKTFLTYAGGHFHQSPDIENCYSGGMTIDKNDPLTVIGSVPVKGRFGETYELVRFTVSPNGKVSNSKQLTFNSRNNNVRPFSIRGLPPDASLAWMHGKYYDWIVSKQRPEGFPTAIQTNIKLPKGISLSETGKIFHQRYDGKEMEENIQLPQLKEFSLAMSISLKDSVSGSILIHFSGLTYGIPQQGEPRPYITHSHKKHKSGNLLATSNRWRNEVRATNGIWYTPEKLTDFKLVISYDGVTLRTYINDLLDQSIPIKGIILNKITKGDLAKSIHELAVYDYPI